MFPMQQQPRHIARQKMGRKDAFWVENYRSSEQRTIQALNTREVVYSPGGLHSSSASRYFLVAGIGEYEDCAAKDMAASSA